MMASVLRDCKYVLLDFMEKGTTINAASYCATLGRLRLTIQRQRPSLLTTGVLLLQDEVETPAPLQRRDSNATLAALQVDTFGTSTIQPRFGAECILHPTGC
jgi:hypothetical protein